MANMELGPELLRRVRGVQLDEETGAALYAFMAKREKNPENRRVLSQMSTDEAKHAAVWESYTGEKIRPRGITMLRMKLITVLMGFTFMVKLMQKTERFSSAEYESLREELPEAASVLEDELHHERELYDMLDEERLHYVGAMVLGLNDALVELTGAIAGVTFALANSRLVAMTGIITGVSATLSMMASNYLAQRAEGSPDALKSSAYTGAAYIITVALLVLPYLLFPEKMYVPAFAVMIAIVLLIILFFNYYISVAKEEPFFRRFLEMAAISLSVAVISFIIAILAKRILGISV
ncbi:VIT1/CCC1 transporter family protein [Papillibacter cinnamivorans]|uniref:Predicted Fe2+/Mn2+ transporter, VIT1/CCC1 family n=1 Tax=Papillibacter cinnamivorans DSM 12816 TaxID=1122930 RepID=A0A1W2C0Q0_9FIRM|nr:VIT1/CCC1 transporter family protein [Papillibacter cinnamivorans]SMC78759.1 Predicted Fe2+/Mn2+ transporter, VIT1/CCC1 family [Papillibacter cinnamivorans DSM 12816]